MNPVPAFLALLLLFLKCGVPTLAQPCPIPSRPTGVVLGDGRADARVQIEVFYCLMCPDSRRVHPILRALTQRFDGADLRVAIRLFPLPYHDAGYAAAHVAHVVGGASSSVSAESGSGGESGRRDDALAIRWIEAAFAHQSRFANEAIKEMPRVLVERDLVALAANATRISESIVMREYQSGKWEKLTRVEWKLAGCWSVSGTPSFFVNGVPVAEAYNWGLNEWVVQVEALLASIPRVPARPLFFVGA
ncbi:hypothetical protein BC830DRAFT_628576 [Chytriomyces sp. MP71]|nr:hypothetical protein BC830DRAFT_628576 [Chytriomyces sp. MP71]